MGNISSCYVFMKYTMTGNVYLIHMHFFISGSAGYQYSTNTFIYSLKNYYGYGYFKKDVNTNYWYATYSYYSYGPTFGGGHDIYIADNAGNNYNSYFNCRCYSYTSPYCNCYMWTGSNNFCPSELEVYNEVLA